MNLIACGINHQKTPIALREKLSFSLDEVARAITSFISQTGTREAIILSTCNRTEFYCIDSDVDSVFFWLINYKGVSPSLVAPYWYKYCETEAVRHILRVAAGLDSMIVGEPQILGQMKTAFARALESKGVGKQLNHLFQYIFSSTKEVRTKTAIGNHPVSIAFACLNLAKKIFPQLSETKVLLIGAGGVIEEVLTYLYQKGIHQFIIANRTPEKAQLLALPIKALVISLEQLPDYLYHADIVITATASTLPVIRKSLVESVLKERKQRPLFIADLSLPRNVETEVGQLADVYLYTLDDLQEGIKNNLGDRQRAARQAEKIIEERILHYEKEIRLLAATPLIARYRAQAEKMRQDELEKVLGLLQKGEAPEKLLEQFSYTLTNKLLHTPSVELRRAAKIQQKEFLEVAERLLGLV